MAKDSQAAYAGGADADLLARVIAIRKEHEALSQLLADLAQDIAAGKVRPLRPRQGAKRYPCPICRQTFQWPGLRDDHAYRVHGR
jgi:hypothetical protein